MLKRSKMAPLTVTITIYLRRKALLAAQSVKSHLSRIRELHITTDEVVKHIFDTKVPIHAPLLEILSLINSTHDCEVYILLNSATRLRRLELIGVPFCWEHFSLAVLAHLTLILDTPLASTSQVEIQLPSTQFSTAQCPYFPFKVRIF